MRTALQEKITFRGTILKETDRAILFAIEVEDDEYQNEWFPLSQVHEIHHTAEAVGYDELIVSQWIASKKGLV